MKFHHSIQAPQAPARIVVDMPVLDDVLGALKQHEHDLRRMGVVHAGVFGSVARGESRPDSDIDVLVDLDPAHPIGVFEYSRLKLFLGELLGEGADIANRRTLKPLLRDSILRDCVNAF
jgi:uncharacterized protein